MRLIKRFFQKEKERNRLRLFIYTVYWSLIGVFVLFAILIGLNAILSHSVKESYFFNRRPTFVITGSMEPVIQVNSLVVLEPVSFADLNEGDIVRYTSGRGYSVMHRIIHKTPSYIVTKGDNNDLADTFPVFPQQVTGRVVSIHNEVADFITAIFGKFSYENMVGSVLRGMAGMIGVGLFIAVMVCVFIVVFEMISITKFFRKYNTNLVESSSYWLDDILNREEEKDVVLKYNESYRTAGLFKRIILSYKFRRWYNGLCNIEKEVQKTKKRLKTLNMSI